MMPITPHFEDDKELLESLCPNEKDKFESWFTELNTENLKRNNAFYSGQPLEKSTGITCWFDFFVEGYTAVEALDEDLTNA